MMVNKKSIIQSAFLIKKMMGSDFNFEDAILKRVKEKGIDEIFIGFKKTLEEFRKQPRNQVKNSIQTLNLESAKWIVDESIAVYQKHDVFTVEQLAQLKSEI